MGQRILYSEDSWHNCRQGQESILIELYALGGGVQQEATRDHLESPTSCFLLPLIPSRLSCIPPLSVLRPACDFHLIQYVNNESKCVPGAYQNFFLYIQSTRLYTDESLSKVQLDVPSYLETGFSDSLYHLNSVYMAEPYTIYRALLFCWQQPWWCYSFAQTL
jgi:hypothetical protein